jgi:MarR family transcriptional regulator, negative regulator of the multidrug operon emrRAB
MRETEPHPPQTAALDPDAILELARQRIEAVVPDADLLAFSLVFTLVRAADRITYELDAAQRPMGWTWPGFRVLFWVWLLGPLEPRTIASLVSASRASISSALNTLERDGFVVRSRGSNDRRLVTVDLTARGREQILEAFKAVNSRERKWLAPFSAEEQKLLAKLLGALLENVSAISFDS